MDAVATLVGLAEMHPELEWQEITAATAALFDERGLEPPYQFKLDLIDVPGFGSESLHLSIDRAGIPAERIARVRRTYDGSRRVELAAIAIAGLSLYHGGGHEIMDVALRGSGADYLVDSARHLLEVAGRSRRSDFETAWEQRWKRLKERATDSYYLCVIETDTCSGRLQFSRK
jgi:hypothetical protein